MDSTVKRDELLYRAVKRSQPDAMQDGRPTSALFKQEDGVSVDRDGGRPEAEILSAFQGRFAARFKGLVCVGADVCLDASMAVIPETEHSIYHAEIYNDFQKTPLSSLNALILADHARVVAYDPDVVWSR